MGKRGREIVQLDIKKVTEQLRKAMSMEWQAAYYYWYCSQVAAGLESKPISEFFKGQVTEEIGHAEEISERIQQLGGDPVRTPHEWSKYSKSVEPVRDNWDLAGMIRKALQVEAEAISMYNALTILTRTKDIVTHELAEELLKSEVEEEEVLENLLGSFFSESRQKATKGRK